MQARLLFTLLIACSLTAKAQKKNHTPLFFRAAIGSGYRVAKMSEDIKQYSGLEKIVQQQRSGMIVAGEAGIFLDSDGDEAVSLMHQRFSSSASGPVNLNGNTPVMYGMKERISITAVMFNTRIRFKRKGESGATFRAGTGYSHYYGNAYLPGTGQSSTISKGGIGYLLGADADFLFANHLFFNLHTGFLASAINIDSNNKENVSMLTAAVGIKCIW